MWASAILRLARTIRLPMVGSATRKARAISPVVRPPSARSVSAKRAGMSSAGWQQVNISRSRSSTIALSSVTGACSWRSRRTSSARRSARSATDRSRRRRSMARRRAATVSHAPGFAGTPSRGHVVSAAAYASWTASSASWKSPTWRINVASTAARSSRNARATASAVGSLKFQVHDGANLHASVADQRDAPGDLQRLVEIVGLDQVVAGERLLGDRERAIGELGLAGDRADGRSAGGPMQAAAPDEQPGLLEALGQLEPDGQLGLALGELLAFDLCGIQQEHVLGHHASFCGLCRYDAGRTRIWTYSRSVAIVVDAIYEERYWYPEEGG